MLRVSGSVTLIVYTPGEEVAGNLPGIFSGRLSTGNAATGERRSDVDLVPSRSFHRRVDGCFVWWRLVSERSDRVDGWSGPGSRV